MADLWPDHQPPEILFHFPNMAARQTVVDPPGSLHLWALYVPDHHHQDLQSGSPREPQGTSFDPEMMKGAEAIGDGDIMGMYVCVYVS